MNSKLKVSLSSLLVVLILMGSSLSFAKPINIYHDNKKLNLHTDPIIMNGRVLVPMRSVLDIMYFDYEWDSKTRTVYGYYDSLGFELKIGSKYAKVTSYDWDIGDDVTIIEELDAPPIIRNGYTLVPIRFVAECLGKLVLWDNSTRSVFIDEYPFEFE